MPISRREVLTGMSLGASMLIARRGFAADALSPTWDLRDLYGNAGLWETSAASAEADVGKLGSFAAGFGRSSQRFADALTAISHARREVMRLSTYARLCASADLRDVAAQQRQARGNALSGKLDAATAWLDGAIRALGRQGVNVRLAADPSLARFRHELDDVLRSASHALTGAEIEALASSSELFDGPQNTYNQLLGSDMPHPTITLSTGARVMLDDSGYTQARVAPDRADRKLVFDAFWGSYGTYQNTLGTILATKVSGDNMLADLRRYPDALDAALDATATPRAVFTTMITEARAGIPLLQRYLKLRQRALKIPDLCYYDMYAPLGRTNRVFTADTARATMIASVQKLGPDYVTKLTAASGARWVDFPSRQGKYAGGFMNPDAYDVHPYILLNFTPDYHGLTSYVHEWGHAMHTVMANSKQPFETAHYETFVAEIASTCNEQMLVQYLIDTAANRDDKIFYLGQLLDLLRLNIFREPMLSEFEHAVHEQSASGLPMSGSAMSATYFKLLQDYHSPAMSINPAYAVEWSFIPQFYNAYYSFQYATSITASSYFSQAILAGDTSVRNRYLALLSAGGSDYAYSLVRGSGVDLASPEPYRRLMRRFDDLLDQLERLI